MTSPGTVLNETGCIFTSFSWSIKNESPVSVAEVKEKETVTKRVGYIYFLFYSYHYENISIVKQSGVLQLTSSSPVWESRQNVQPTALPLSCSYPSPKVIHPNVMIAAVALWNIINKLLSTLNHVQKQVVHICLHCEKKWTIFYPTFCPTLGK